MIYNFNVLIESEILKSFADNGKIQKLLPSCEGVVCRKL